MAESRRKTTQRVVSPRGAPSGARQRSVPPPSGAHPSKTPGPVGRLRPDELAILLDRWALRREKVLEHLDVRAARQARELAVACRALAIRLESKSEAERDQVALSWLELRAKVAAFLSPSGGKNGHG